MNQWIYDVYRSGGSQAMYATLGNVGFYIALLYGLFHAWKMKIPIWKVLIIFVGLYVGRLYLLNAIFEILLQMQRNEIFGMKTVTNSVVRSFVFLPLIVHPLAVLLNLKWRKVCDAITMFPLLHVALAQIPCLFTGCCRGYVSSWGVYVAQIEAYCVPVPLIETFLSLLVFGWLVYRTVKRKFVPDGKLYPLMLVMYGAVRFLCEMLRDNEKIALGCSGVGFHAILMCIMGAVWLLIEKLISKRKSEKLEV